MNKQEFQQKIKDMKPPKFFTAVTLGEAFEAGFEQARVNALLASDFLDEPEKPVVPQYVADWVANSREYDYEFCDFFDCNYQSEEVYRWLKCENRRQSELNSLALSMLVVHGRDAVIVEEEKLYTVEIPNPNGGEYSRTYLGKYASGKVGLYNWTGFTHIAYADDWKKEEKAQLTEAEIKKDFDWAWKFAEEVE